MTLFACEHIQGWKSLQHVNEKLGNKVDLLSEVFENFSQECLFCVFYHCICLFVSKTQIDTACKEVSFLSFFWQPA